MLQNLFIFSVSLFLVIRGATLATVYAARLAESFRLPKYVVGFIIIAVISILPETFIAIQSAFQGMPAFGLGTLFGSNVADMTLVFAAIVLLAGRRIKIKSRILKDNRVYPLLLLLPVVLGFDGNYTRLEGLALIIIGAAFYWMAFRTMAGSADVPRDGVDRRKNLLFLLFGMAILLLGSHFTVASASALARDLGVSPVLIGMLVVGLGTTMPELFFSLKSVQKDDDDLAVGDILGTVLADATIVVGILALISPFAFPLKIVLITGIFMVLASFLLFGLMRSDRALSKKEAHLLMAFWLLFVIVEFLANR
jgi:cation:H+ antiporter